MPIERTNADLGVERREKILAFIAAFVEKHGYSPTVREVASGVGLASPGAAHRQLEHLVDEGALRKLHVTSRSVVYALPKP